MCLLLIAFKVHPDYKLIIAANRDEFYDRPASPAAFWKDYPDILAGRDIKAGGTWLGITRNGRIAAITNYRKGLEQKTNAPSRGDLTKDFLVSEIAPEEYGEMLRQKGHLYNGFNLVFGTPDKLYYYSNVGDSPLEIKEGIYGLSNCLLDTPWPKVEQSKFHLKSILKENPADVRLMELLSNSEVYRDELLPDTGIGLDLERHLSAIFIETPVYGTRASTVIKISNNSEVSFLEKSFGREGFAGESSFTFKMK